MPVPSSGAISLNDFHVEAGGTSGTQCSINDADIRGLIGKGSGSQMAFNEWYGASAGIFSNTVNLTLSRTTTGNTDIKGNFTATGYQYQLSVGSWNSLSGGQYNSANRLIGNFNATQTSIPTSNYNPMGAISGTTYDSIFFVSQTTTNLQGVTGSTSQYIQFQYVSRATSGNGNGVPVYSSSASTPTNWTALNLTFTYGGTNYNWTWTRTNASDMGSFINMDFTFGQAESVGYMVQYFANNGKHFTGNNTSGVQTITGAKFTLT